MVQLPKLTPRAALVVSLSMYTLGSGGFSLAYAILVHLGVRELKANTLGDPEKKRLDECLRDFEGLSVDSDDYNNKREECVKDIIKDEAFARLPQIRVTVDEHICSPGYLCQGAPRGCADRGEARTPDFEAGEVTRCYDLIARQKAALLAETIAALAEQVESECTRGDRWDKYPEKVTLDYCMWKHAGTGICANLLRTTCPADASRCCPQARNYLDRAGDQELLGSHPRADVYECRQSPTVGLYCHHLQYTIPGNSTGGIANLCTDVSCDNFAWCRDFADVPGLCLSEACQAYNRAASSTIPVLVLLGAALLFDLAHPVVACRWPGASRAASVVNLVAMSLKAVAWLLAWVRGLPEFMADVEDHRCYNSEGNEFVSDLKTQVETLLAAAVLTTAGSLCLAPLSVKWGGHLTTSPYARVT